MEALFKKIPSIESIGRKPFLKKWLKRKPYALLSLNGKHFSCSFDDIYRLLFQQLERINLELAYQFRYTIEIVGVNPFIKRLSRLDKALRKATNKSFQPLERLLDEILVEEDWDFEAQLAGRTLEVAAAKGATAEKVEFNDISSQIEENRILSYSKPPEWMSRYTLIFEPSKEYPVEEKDNPDLLWHENTFQQLDSAHHKDQEEEQIRAPEISVRQPQQQSDYQPFLNIESKKRTGNQLETLSVAPKNGDSAKIKHIFEGFKLNPKKQIKSPKLKVIRKTEPQSTVVVKAEKGEGKLVEPGLPNLAYSEAKDHKFNFKQKGTGKKNKPAIASKLSFSPSQIERKYEVPPPLYNFKAVTRSITLPSNKAEVSGDSIMLISQDSLNLRSNYGAAQKHFLMRSKQWDRFNNRDDGDQDQKDPNSLVIDFNSIENRINNIKVETKHTLDWTEEDKRAFDWRMRNWQYEEVELTEDDAEFFDESFLEEFEEYEELTKEEHEKKRNEIFNQSLQRLNNRDGTLFDYMSGKIALKDTDKYEIDQWIRAQNSASTEVYRLYSEIVFQNKSGEITEIQNAVKSRLYEKDLPTQNVRAIFDKIKEESDLKDLQQKDLLKVLQRQDYLSEDIFEEDALSFSKAYSRHRDWRSTVQSPRIIVRSTRSEKKSPYIPLTAFKRKWSITDTPTINVRTSSDYRKKHALSSLDKVTFRRKSQAPESPKAKSTK